MRYAHLNRVGVRSTAERHENPFAVFSFFFFFFIDGSLNERCAEQSVSRREWTSRVARQKDIENEDPRPVVSCGRKQWSREPMANGTDESCHGRIDFIYFVFFLQFTLTKTISILRTVGRINYPNRVQYEFLRKHLPSTSTLLVLRFGIVRLHRDGQTRLFINSRISTNQFGF